MSAVDDISLAGSFFARYASKIPIQLIGGPGNPGAILPIIPIIPAIIAKTTNASIIFQLNTLFIVFEVNFVFLQCEVNKKSNRKKIENKLSRLNELYVDGIIDREKYKQDYADLQSQIIDEPEEEKPFWEKIIDWFKDLFDKLFGWMK